MDNGEVIPGLNDDWTFAGAKVMEWMCGFVMLVIVSNFVDKPASWAPMLLVVMVGTTMSMATLRRRFPDEERGLRNSIMTSLGFEPTDIPTPASLQPYWSGTPMRSLDNETEYMQLGLNEIFPGPRLDDDDDVSSYLS